ncbi:hypothetical protein GCM10027578_20140 [Spirosoma luteolum]
MSLGPQLTALRKQAGITQEELAERTQVTVRTIQRIERGESIPRAFTLKRIATALGVPFDQLHDRELNGSTPPQPPPLPAPARYAVPDKQFLTGFYLSCFAFLIIPYVHVLIPLYLLKKSRPVAPSILRLTQSTLRQQIVWVILVNVFLLAALAYNTTRVQAGYHTYLVSYLGIALLMYALNALLLGFHLLNVNRYLAAA